MCITLTEISQDGGRSGSTVHDLQAVGRGFDPRPGLVRSDGRAPDLQAGGDGSSWVDGFLTQ